MGDEKSILYTDVEWKRSWGKWNEPPPTTPKSSLHLEKLMLCILWDWKGVLHYELFPENQTVNSNEYFSQSDQLKAALAEKCLKLVNRKCIIFYQDDVRPHVSLMTRQKLSQPDLEDLTHLPYLPDIALSEFHLFCFFKKSSHWKKILIFWKTIKGTWNRYKVFLKKIQSFGKMELGNCLKNGRR